MCKVVKDSVWQLREREINILRERLRGRERNIKEREREREREWVIEMEKEKPSVIIKWALNQQISNSIT